MRHKIRRNNLDISAEILNLAKGGTRKTRLVYQANLNFTLLKKYLKKLLDRGMIETVDGIIFTTNKGIEFLEQYSDLTLPFY